MVIGFLTSAAPLLLASLGALFTELGGSLGIFIEGFMEMGAFFVYLVLVKSGSAFWAILAVATGAALAGWALAFFVNVSGANPFIAGLALNLAAAGITNSLSAAVFGTKGVLRNIGAPMPVIGQVPVFVWLAGVGFALAAVVVNNTRAGLRLRAAGLSAQAARERGIEARRYQAAAWAVAAMLAAVAGACLSLRVGAYTPGGVAGRGWIALAAVYLGFRTVWGTAAAAIVFALVERIGISLQGAGALPATALLGVPAALALVFYTLSCVVRKKFRLE